MRPTIASAIWILLAIGVNTSAATPADSDANAASGAMVKRFTESWNRADGAAYGENYWPEAELIDPSGGIVNGQKAIVQEHLGTPFSRARKKARSSSRTKPAKTWAG
jgi:hypothetical protein